MKPIRVFFKLLLAALFVLVAAISVEPIMASALPDYIAQHLAEGTASLAMATAAAQAVDGTVTTDAVDAASTNLLRPEISQLITKIRPDVFPLDTILREVGNVGKVESREYKFYSSDVRGVQDTMAAGHVQADVLTSNIEVTNIHIWTVDDVIFFPAITGGDSVELRAQVLAITAATSLLTISAINGVGAGGSGDGDYLPAIANEAAMTRIGNAKNEIAAQNTPYANMPTDTFNYVQIFMCQVEESFVNFKHNKEVEWNINDYRTDAIYDMRRQGELAMIFGYPKKDWYDSVAQTRKDFMGGARHFITKAIAYVYGTAGTNANFNSWARQIFTGNNGSYKRIIFAGNGLVEWLMNIPVVEKRLDGAKSEVIGGIKFKVIETYFGDLLIRRHQSFDDVSGYTYNGLVLDLENVERRFREITNSVELNLDKTGQRRVTAYRITESWTMAFRNPLTHAWIEGSAT